MASFSTSGVTAVLASALINQIQNHTITMTAPSTFFAILYEYDKISTPSFTNQFVKCSRVSLTVYNWCTMLGYPANYII